MSDKSEKKRNEISRISVAIGDFKVELEGTHSNVTWLMGSPLYEFIEGLQDVVGEVPSDEPEKKKISIIPATEYPPTLQLGNPKTPSEAVSTLMVEQGWGREPRSFPEIKSALETNGIYYSKGPLAGTLNYLVKKGTLRRLGTRGSFKYVSA